MRKTKKRKTGAIPIQVVESDGTKKRIGKYYPDKNLFCSERLRSIHFMRKWNAWGLDCKVVDFLVEKDARIHIKDKETQWEYECSAKDLKFSGREAEYNTHRPQYFLGEEHWEVTKAKARSYVIECMEKDCAHNFSNTCLRGVIKIGNDGECQGYEDRQG